MKRKIALFIYVLIWLIFFPFGCSKELSEKVDLSPANWPEGEFEKYEKLSQIPGGPKPLAAGRKGMVCGTTKPLAVRAGLEALKQGGSAVDAVIVTSLTQIALDGGITISYAGNWGMGYYEAATGKVNSLNANWNTVQEEKDPLSIPDQTHFLEPLPSSSAGRTVLVPGFMAGVQAAHERFGKLAWDALFEPAIYFAEQGFEMKSFLAGSIRAYEKVLTRTPEMKQVFAKENGELYKAGDLFKQPQLAETLKRVASQGVDYMYKGEWAKRFVESVRKEGGKMTLKDLEDYRAIWTEPYHTQYRDYDVYPVCGSGFDGLTMIEAVNLLELANLPQYGHYTKSPESLFWLMQISRANYYLNEYMYNDIPIPPEILKKYFPDINLSPESRMKKETAKQLWNQLKKLGGWNSINHELLQTWKRPSHTASVVAVDKEGNVAAVIHSINGSVCNFVDGISTASSGGIWKKLINKTGSGKRLPDIAYGLIVLKDGNPFFTSGGTGMAFFEVTLQNLVNILDFGMNPQEAADTSKFGGLGSPDNDLFYTLTERHKQCVVQGQFSDEILKAIKEMGQEIMVKKDPTYVLGGWVGIKIDSEARKLEGGGTSFATRRGCAIGY